MTKIELIAAALDGQVGQGRSGCWLDRESMWCTALEARGPGEEDSSSWIQIHGGMINMSYKDIEDPGSLMRQKVRSFPDCKCVGWRANQYATFDLSGFDEKRLPQLIDDILRQYYGLPADYKLEWTTEELGCEGSGSTSPMAEKGRPYDGTLWLAMSTAKKSEGVVTAARAKIIWGESPKNVFAWLIEKGMDSRQANEHIEAFVRERAMEVRRDGLRELVTGIVIGLVGLVLGIFLYGHSSSLVMVRWSGLVILVFCFSVWMMVKGIGKLIGGARIQGSLNGLDW